MAKSFMMSAKRSGVNLSDKEELNAFFLDMQRRQLARLRKENKAEKGHKSIEDKPVISHQPKVGRNEPCPCGSGKKYKKCCGR